MKPKSDEKRSWIGANVTPESRDEVVAFIRTVDDPRFRERTVADFIRLLVADYMAGELVRIFPSWKPPVKNHTPAKREHEVEA